MNYKLFTDLSTTPVFKEGGIGTKQLLDAKMMRPVCKALYPYITFDKMYRETLSGLPYFFEQLKKQYFLDYPQLVKRLAQTLGKSRYKNEWEVISFANNATICTLAAMRRCLAHTLPSYFIGDVEETNPGFFSPKITDYTVVFGFGFDDDNTSFTPWNKKGNADIADYVYEGFYSAKKELARYGIVLNDAMPRYGYAFEIHLYQSFNKLKDHAEFVANERLHPVPEGVTFNFDDPLAGLPFADEE